MTFDKCKVQIFLIEKQDVTFSFLAVHWNIAAIRNWNK